MIFFASLILFHFFFLYLLFIILIILLCHFLKFLPSSQKSYKFFYFIEINREWILSYFLFRSRTKSEVRKYTWKKDFSKLLRVVASFSKYRIAMTLKVELPHSFMLSTGNIYFFSKTVFFLSFLLVSIERASEWEKMRNEKFVLPWSLVKRNHKHNLS